jgi:hypothetical protein
VTSCHGTSSECFGRPLKCSALALEGCSVARQMLDVPATQNLRYMIHSLPTWAVGDARLAGRKLPQPRARWTSPWTYLECDQGTTPWLARRVSFAANAQRLGHNGNPALMSGKLKLRGRHVATCVGVSRDARLCTELLQGQTIRDAAAASSPSGIVAEACFARTSFSRHATAPALSTPAVVDSTLPPRTRCPTCRGSLRTGALVRGVTLKLSAQRTTTAIARHTRDAPASSPHTIAPHDWCHAELEAASANRLRHLHISVPTLIAR